jgi:uncharacterized protein YjbI with pentapeptide repeats
MANTLIDRWEGHSGEKRIRAISYALLKGNIRLIEKNVDRTTNGLLDLRYIPLRFTVKSKLSNQRYENIDFSHADLGYVILSGCEFQNCIFDNAHVEKWNERNCTFDNVSFKRMKFLDSAMGISSSKYIDVDFSLANLIDTSFFSARFISCNFSFTKLDGIDFDASRFENCKFAGIVKSVWFNKNYRFPDHETLYGKAPDNLMSNVDFSDAYFCDVTFTGGIDLSTVKLPADGKHFLIKHFDKVLEILNGELNYLPVRSRDTIATWINAYKVHAETQPMNILNAEEICQNMGEDIGQEFVDLVKKTESRISN